MGFIVPSLGFFTLQVTQPQRPDAAGLADDVCARFSTPDV